MLYWWKHWKELIASLMPTGRLENPGLVAV
jgi:hypothetical protein